jgi:hypothetical protein
MFVLIFMEKFVYHDVVMFVMMFVMEFVYHAN